MPTKNLVLTSHQATFVERLVRSGRYHNASEVLSDGLRLVEQREAEDASRLVALRGAIQVGDDDFAQGAFRQFDTPDVLGEHLANVAAKHLAST